VYNDSEKSGSVAAPTAGLHFTPELMKELENKGVIIEKVCLHV
jgi:S-adenosylmethionine:tRNA ribosyltransferase-isomerase